MKKRIEKLLTVKSIVTIILTLVFSYLSVTGEVSGQEFLTVFVIVIGFYFGTQSKKDEVKEPTEIIQLGGAETVQLKEEVE